LPVTEWINLFELCHEWRWYGERQKQADAKHIKTISLGQYVRVEWPDGKPLLDQYNVVIEIFIIIKDENARINAKRINS